MSDNNFNESNFPCLFSLNNDVKELIKIIKNICPQKNDFSEQIHTKYKDSFYDNGKTPKPSTYFWENRSQNDSTEAVPIAKIQMFKDKTGLDASGAKIVYGIDTDDFLLQNNLLALVFGSKILMKKQLKQSQTQEAEEVSMHELTHVAQNKNKEEYRNSTKQEMEAEAEANEKYGKYETEDPIEDLKVGEKVYRLKKSVIKKIEKKVDLQLNEWVESQRDLMSEEEYLELLIRYSKYLEQRNIC